MTFVSGLKGAALGMLLASTILAGPGVAGPQDNSLRVAFTEEILELDYNYTTKREYIIISDLIDDNLFRIDPATNEVLPSLATGYTYVDDRTIEVKLREGVTFHDGRPFRAADVAYTYNFVVSPESESHAGPTHVNWLERTEAVDDLTVRFHLLSDYPLAIRDLATRIRIRPEGTYHNDKGEMVRNAVALNPVGLGPYMVEKFAPSQELVLKRFPGYFTGGAKGEPTLDQIVIRTIPDVGTQQAELMAGGIDWMYNVPLDVAESLGATPLATHLSGPDLRVSFVVLDAAGYTDADGPLTNPVVRRAMNHAVNRAEIAQYLIGGSAQAIHTPCHPAQFGCDQDVPNYEFDREKAKAMLAEAGYPNGFPLDLWAYRERPVAEAVAADLTAAGIQVNLRYVQLASLDQARKERQIPAYIGTWGSGGTADTAAIANIHFNDTTDRNLTGNPRVTELMLGAEATSKPEERKALYSEAINLIADQAYWLPLVSYSVNYLVNPELNFPLSEDGLPRLFAASWN